MSCPTNCVWASFPRMSFTLNISLMCILLKSPVMSWTVTSVIRPMTFVGSSAGVSPITWRSNISGARRLSQAFALHLSLTLRAGVRVCCCFAMGDKLVPPVRIKPFGRRSERASRPEMGEQVRVEREGPGRLRPTPTDHDRVRVAEAPPGSLKLMPSTVESPGGGKTDFYDALRANPLPGGSGSIKPLAVVNQREGLGQNLSGNQEGVDSTRLVDRPRMHRVPVGEERVEETSVCYAHVSTRRGVR